MNLLQRAGEAVPLQQPGMAEAILHAKGLHD